MIIELPLAISVAVAAFGFGIIGGMLLHYLGEHKPLLTKYHELIHTLTHMKKQGFVPQHEIKQVKKLDVSMDVREL